MRSIKLFILIGLLFFVLSGAATGYVWFMVQGSLSSDAAEDTAVVPANEDKEEAEPAPETSTVPADTQTQVTEHGSFAEQVPPEGMPLPTDSLTDTQKQLIEGVGIDTESFVFTQEMAACMEGKVGAERLEEIAGGAQPSPVEVFSLVGCL